MQLLLVFYMFLGCFRESSAFVNHFTNNICKNVNYIHPLFTSKGSTSREKDLSSSKLTSTTKAAKITTKATTAKSASKISATIDVKGILSQLNSWKAADLRKLKIKVDKLLLDHPMVLGPLPDELKNISGKFEVFDNGPMPYEDCKIPDIRGDIAHKYTLKWKNGEELVIVYANQDGLMHAGMAIFVLQGFQCGPLNVVRSFPYGLNSYVDGINELFPILKSHGIDTKDKVRLFLSWILEEVMWKHDTLYLSDAFGDNDSGLFVDFYEDDDEEEEAKEDEEQSEE